jgi:hypothetical protein
MKRFALWAAPFALATVGYLGCDGESEPAALEEPSNDAGNDLGRADGSDAGADSAAQDDARDGDIEADAGSDADGAPDAADGGDGGDADAGGLACSVMNLDGGAPFGDASCNECMSTKCCDDVTACFSYADCLERAECVRACDGGAVCKNACKDAHPDSGTLLAAVSLCLSGQCDGCGTFP